MKPGETGVVFMGSPEFAVPSLRALIAAGYDVRLAVAQPDRPAGRGGRLRPPPAKEEAERQGVPVFQPETFRDPEAVARLAAVEPDVTVVAAYGKILPRSVLAIPARGTLNVHGSLLPRWRGPSPVTAAIMAGDGETGVTIMSLVPKMDAGPMLAARATSIGPDETAGELEERLSALGADLLVDTLPGWLDGSIVAEEQDEALVTYCSLLTKADGHLRRDMTADEAARAVRAYNPWPGAFAGYRDGRLAIWRAHAASATEAEPGQLLVHERRPAIAFTGGLLLLDEVQRAGSKRVSGEAFLNGERANLPSAVGLA